MRGTTFRRLATVVFLCALAPAVALAGSEIVSTMRNVNAVGEMQGFRLNPAYDAAAPMTAEDLAPVQAFEILRPGGKPVTLGRLYTSCTCVQLEAPKRNFGPDERAILQLRNVKHTPLNGQVYAIYVQITSPVRTTLRFDTFVQSNNTMEPPEVADAPQDADAPAESSMVEGPPDIELIVPASEVEPPAAEQETAAAESLTPPEPEPEPEADETDALDAELAALRPTAGQPVEATAEAGNDLVEAAGEAVADAADAVDENIADARDAMDSFFGKPEPTEPAAPAAAPEDKPLPDLFAGLTDRKTESEAVPLPPPSDIAAQGEPQAAAAPAAPSQPAEPAPAVPQTQAAPARAPETQAVQGDAKKPLQMISLITIGVRDMPRAVAFYEALGWRRAARNKYDQTAFFQLNGQVLALYPLAELLGEQNMASAKPAPGGTTLAIHMENKADVYEAYRSFINAGGVSLKEPTEMPSGAVTSYVADPDGNPWEISWVPQFRVDQDGGLWLPGSKD